MSRSLSVRYGDNPRLFHVSSSLLFGPLMPILEADLPQFSFITVLKATPPFIPASSTSVNGEQAERKIPSIYSRISLCERQLIGAAG